jgi:hypothetical protein
MPKMTKLSFSSNNAKKLSPHWLSMFPFLYSLLFGYLGLGVIGGVIGLWFFGF